MPRLKRVWRVVRWVLLIAVGLFALTQFIRPARTNPASDSSLALESHVQVDSNVAAILDRSCADCHSNKTRWPWYTNVAPVSWFVIDHVNHGRSHLNFSEWGRYNQTEQRDLLTQVCLETKRGNMPLSSYTPMHPGSKLSGEDVAALCEWTNRAQPVR